MNKYNFIYLGLAITQFKFQNKSRKMDQMLPSPYNIPGIGTPLHQPEEDQQILPNAMQQQHQHQQQQQQQHSLATMSSPLVGFGLGTPQRSVHAYAPAPSYATPQQMMQPQTPVSVFQL